MFVFFGNKDSDSDDLLNLSVDDIKDNGSFLTVSLKEGKTHSKRIFTVIDEECPFKPCELIRKYLSLRPSNVPSRRLFIGYRQGKCTSQNVGKNTLANVPKKVAQYLGLENPESYTGHTLRTTSASMLVEGGGDLLTLKRHGGWKSSSVAEGYIEESIARKVDISKKLFK
jgi:site-specific recombinase XerD